MIPKTWNVVHLKENISILDFELSVDEMADITSLNKGKCLNYNSFVAQRGLPKNIEIGKGLKILIIYGYVQQFSSMEEMVINLLIIYF